MGAGAWAGYAVGDSEEITACAHSRTGQLRLLADGDDCRQKEVPVSWSIQGPIGPPGAPGTTGWTTSRGSVAATLTDGGYWAAEKAVTCPEGQLVTGGGYTYFNYPENPANVRVKENGPRDFNLGPNANPRSWQVSIEADEPGTLAVDAVCANAS